MSFNIMPLCPNHQPFSNMASLRLVTFLFVAVTVAPPISADVTELANDFLNFLMAVSKAIKVDTKAISAAINSTALKGPFKGIVTITRKYLSVGMKEMHNVRIDLKLSKDHRYHVTAKTAKHQCVLTLILKGYIPEIETAKCSVLIPKY